MLVLHAIMVCAFIPLFTMQGPEGQMFGPMADTYAFSLARRPGLGLTLTPVLCLFFFTNFKPVHENLLVRHMKNTLSLATEFLSEAPLAHGRLHVLS